MERASADTLVVYANDNYGYWDASRDGLVRRALQGAHPELVEPIKPEREYAFVWRPRHSAFYDTSLNYLLRERGINRVVIAGQVTEHCVLYTAPDAYTRHFDIVVPSDAVVSLHPRPADASPEMMRRSMRAETSGKSARS